VVQVLVEVDDEQRDNEGDWKDGQNEKNEGVYDWYSSVDLYIGHSVQGKVRRNGHWKDDEVDDDQET